nr:gliding motility-associated C-terminal domain-containing protein [Saprospiraceae bacterium]
MRKEYYRYKVWRIIKKSNFFLLTFLLFSGMGVQEVYGQVNSPEFKCISGDSLVWEIPEILCGDLLGYVIHRAEQQEGPYEVIDTIDNPMTTFFEGPNPFGLTYYYYLSSLADCPDEEILYSDTLSNLPLRSVPIKSLSVIDGQVLIQWNKSEDPNISQYVIYRNTSLGTIPIDTVQNILEYTDESSNPTDKPEIYYVLAMDDCGTKSFFDEPHNTLLIDYNLQPCQQRITIEYNEYRNWPGGISYHILWAEIEGEFVPVDTAASDVFSIDYNELIKDEDICFYITAENTSLGASSKSNTICIDSDIVEPVRDLVIFDYCYEESIRQLNMRWYWNETAEMESYQVLIRQKGVLDFRPLVSEDIQGSLTDVNELSFNLPTDIQMPVEIALRTTDICGITRMSNVVNPLHLSGQTLDETTNLLEWEYTFPEGSFNTDQVLESQLLDGRLQSVNVTGFEESLYEDPTTIDDPAEGRICYTLISSGQLTLPNGEVESFSCISNTVCLTKEIKVYIPNAFKPSGVNQIFRPYILFQESITHYELKIYDRWGQALYESRNPEWGWDGTMRGRKMDPGVYLYFIEIEIDNGEVFNSTGTVKLFR